MEELSGILESANKEYKNDEIKILLEKFDKKLNKELTAEYILQSLGPRIPERAKDALSAKEFEESYKKCGSNRACQEKLVLEQLAKGNVPNSYRFF